MPRKRRPTRPGALTDLAPLRILTQIIILQVAYYLCAAVLIIFSVLVAGKELSLDLLFSWRTVRGDTTVGWMLGLVWLLNSLISVILLLLLIARSKLVPDFALTIHFLHLIISSLYTHAIPSSFFWWCLQLLSSALMTILGVWACQWRELRPISFNFSNPSSQSRQPQNQTDETTGDDAEGLSRGRGRGRGRDGTGNYEMVSMGNEDSRV